MNREVVDKACERGILGLVLGILLYGPLRFGAVRGMEFAVIEALTIGVVALWALRLWVAPRPQLLWPPICWAVLAFTGYAVARYFTADVEYLARQELVRVLVYACLFLAILNNLHRQETITIIVFTLVFLALAISGYAIYQFLKNSDYVWELIKPYPHRGSGTYICPNHLGGFLEMLLPLALAYAMTGRLKPVTRVFVGYAALVIVAGIGVTLSRGAWVSTTVALALLFCALMFRRQYRIPALVLMAVIVGAGIFGISRSGYIEERLQRLAQTKQQPTTDMRFALWKPAWQMWREHPWWGVGPGHYDTRFGGYRPESVQLSPERAHNDYLNTLADWGLVGAGLVLCALALLGAGALQTWRSRRLAAPDLGGKATSNKYAFMLGATLGLTALLVHSFVDFNMQIPANAILAVTLMALLSAHLRFATERFWVRSRIWTTAFLTLALAAAACYLAPQAYRQAAEFVWLQRAQKCPNFSATQTAILKRAFDVEPMNSRTAYAIGEALRRQSQEGGQHYQGQDGVDYRQLAGEAMKWYQKAIELNRWDSRSYSQYGWCLDWLDRCQESGAFFQKAEELDPNNYYNVNNVGLHYVALGNYAAAQPWFERSTRLQWVDNDIAKNYLGILQARQLEQATNPVSARIHLPSQ